MEKSANQK